MAELGHRDEPRPPDAVDSPVAEGVDEACGLTTPRGRFRKAGVAFLAVLLPIAGGIAWVSQREPDTVQAVERRSAVDIAVAPSRFRVETPSAVQSVPSVSLPPQRVFESLRTAEVVSFSDETVYLPLRPSNQMTQQRDLLAGLNAEELRWLAQRAADRQAANAAVDLVVAVDEPDQRFLSWYQFIILSSGLALLYYFRGLLRSEQANES